jgi:hypothetical protein
MAERNLGDRGIWIGVVVDVKDIDQSGRVQVRIMGKHDDRTNIPDSSLPWAQVVQPVTSPALGRIGTSPVGLIRVSRVVGVWLDPDDQQYPLIIGTIGRAGDPIPGQTTNGAPAINISTGSIPAPAQNSFNNFYTALNPNRPSIRAIDAGQYSIYGVTNNAGVVLSQAVLSKMAIPSVPTIASASATSRDGVIDMARAVDPLGRMSALPCFTISLINIKAILALIRSIGLMVANALRNAILELMQKLGIGRVLAALSAMIRSAQAIQALLNAFNISTCGISLINQKLFSEVNFVIATVIYDLYLATGLVQAAASAIVNIPTSAVIAGTNYASSTILSNIPTLPIANVVIPGGFTPPGKTLVSVVPTNYAQAYYSSSADPYHGYIRWNSTTGFGDSVYTLRNGQPNFKNAQEHITHDIKQTMVASLIPTLSTSSPSLASLTGIVNQGLISAATGANKAAFGAGFAGGANLLLSLAPLLPLLVGSIQNVFQPNVATTRLSNPLSTINSVNRFTQNQAYLAVQAQSLRASLKSVAQGQDKRFTFTPTPIRQMRDPYLG